MQVLEETDNGCAGDWWGVGVVKHEMMFGKLPLYARDKEVFVFFNILLWWSSCVFMLLIFSSADILVNF